MNFYAVAGHQILYMLVSGGILFVLGLCVVYLRKSWKRAVIKGYSREKLMTIVKTSVSAAIVPSLCVVIGLFALVTIIGIPWPWWRLSVVGSVTYETMAADSAVKAAGLDFTRLSQATARDFVLVMYVMSIGIMGGMCFSPFISKRIQFGTMKIKQGDKRWGALGATTFFLVILTVFVVPYFLDFTKGGFVRLLTYLTSLLAAVIINSVSVKAKIPALRTFTLAISMILAMASSVLWNSIGTALFTK
jgi:hypothetical protein